MTTATMSLDGVSARRHLHAHIGAALARLRMQEAIRATVFSLTVVFWILVPLIFFDRLFSLDALGVPVWIIWGCLVALCIPYVLLRAFSSGINESLAAVMTDERLGLHSRLCTALALNPDQDPEFSEAFYSEAAENLAALDPTKAFPYSMPRLAYLLPIPAVIAAGIFYFMPQQDRLGLIAEREDKRRAEAVQKETLKQFHGRLEDLKRDQQEPVSENTAQYKVKQLVKQAEDIAKQVREGKRNPEDAIIAIAELKREIGENKDDLTDGKDFMSRLKKLSTKDLNLEENDFTRDVSKALKSGDASMAARQMRKLARKLKKDIMQNEDMTQQQKAEALKKLQREMEKLAGALAEQEALQGNMREISKKAMEAGEYEALQDEVKKFKAQQGGKSAEEMAEELEEMMDDAADEMERLEDENEPELDEEEEETMEALEGLDEALDEFMEGMNDSCAGEG